MQIHKSIAYKSPSNNNFLLKACRFPILLVKKLGQRLLGAVLRQCFQNPSPISAFRTIWICALLVGEVLIFQYAMRKCSWPESVQWDKSLAEPYRIALIADPQIIDDYSYGRTGLLQKISEIYPDMYMRKNWINMQSIFDPDAVIFMGDLMDGGREWDDEKWEIELYRYQQLFLPKKPEQRIFHLVGNHDVGFGEKLVRGALQRFRKTFGKTNYKVNLGNHSIVVLDTVTLSGSDESIRKEGLKIIGELANDTSNQFPRILMTHVPLYRPPNKDCGPQRQGSSYINQNTGYQYQNLVDEPLTNFILDNVKPKLIFSGDDHDYCEITHEKWNAFEVSVNSFSFAMGVERPGFVLLSLYNPQTVDDSAALPNQHIRRTTESLPQWHLYQQRGDLILLKGQYWKSVGKALLDIGVVGVMTYLICWLWFLV
ncbi:2984_t:CDS:2 [Acaulospora morrowiae]|uniref:2984_t:CDS:1 n=1 Tax=Acaulospora morrowiae TaxID=94023 RepID=A0A9N9G750_9GLOM|nr:2984_t:CDS:2 [Acaulospora morrowiae]